MSKESKIIKDLKERNYKLATQYRYKEIRCVSLEQKNKKYEEAIDKAISLLEDDNVCADIRRFEPKENEEEYGVEQELLEILKKVK